MSADKPWKCLVTSVDTIPEFWYNCQDFKNILLIYRQVLLAAVQELLLNGQNFDLNQDLSDLSINKEEYKSDIYCQPLVLSATDTVTKKVSSLSWQYVQCFSWLKWR